MCKVLPTPYQGRNGRMENTNKNSDPVGDYFACEKPQI